jgi:AraC-like DNA-binding protein
LDTHAKRSEAEPGGRHHVGPPDTLLAEALTSIMRHELSAPDVSVSCIEGALEHDVMFPAEGPPAFSITLALRGCGRANIDGVEPLEIGAGTGTVFWSEHPVSGFDQVDGGQPIEAVEIRFRPAFLKEMVGSVASVLRSALLVDRSDPCTSTILVGFPLPAPLVEVARCILHCPMKAGSAREIYMRGKALEALALTIDTLSRLSPRAHRLSPRDRDRIAEARRLMESSVSEPWTISTLASAVGLSESKLKLGFREIVGRSVREHLREARVDHASVLIEQGHTVTESALASGFQSLSHFSKAFRQIKGVYPRELSKVASRKRRLRT